MTEDKKILEVFDKEKIPEKKSIIEKISFKPNYTARQWLSQLKARIRLSIREMLPAMFDAMEEPKSFRNSDEILDLPLRNFQQLMRKFSSTYDMRANIFDDFLG